MWKRLVPFFLVLALVAAACGGDDAEETTTTAAPTTTTEAATTTTTEAPAELGTIVDIAAGDENFSTLVAAVEAAGLTDALADPDATLTVFAPTNDAFAAALDSLGLTADDLLADTETLTSILTYHVLGSVVTSGDIAAAGTEEIPVETLSGAELVIVVGDAGNVSFKDQSSNVITADIEASNGVIHVIDGVLLPPAS